MDSGAWRLKDGANKRSKDRADIARNMSAIRSINNKTETALRKALHAMGLRYRKYARAVIGKPDIVFSSAKVLVFVDGDYWHGRVLREQGLDAVTRYYTERQRGYWIPKLQRNVARDDDVSRTLAEDGWRVLRYWETDVRRDVAGIASEILNVVNERKRRLADRAARPRGRKANR